LMRTDECGIPKIVQRMRFRGSDLVFEVRLFDGSELEIGYEKCDTDLRIGIHTWRLNDAQYADMEAHLEKHWRMYSRA
jgi:hypothetical protein